MKSVPTNQFYQILQNQMDLQLNLLDIHWNVSSQIFFEKLLPNRRFGFGTVHLNTI